MGSQQACQKPGYIRMARGDRVRVAPRTGGTQLQCSTLHQWRAINYPGRSQAFDEHGACRRPPRVRGEHMRLLAHEAHSDGSAPRARGTQSTTRSTGAGHRVSPACAGNTSRPARSRRWMPGQPRVRGEHRTLSDGVVCGYGSAPRARGTRSRQLADEVWNRVSPACAGNTVLQGGDNGGFPGQPRVRGEHTTTLEGALSGSGSAPRARGTLHQYGSGVHGHRVSPACAGNTSPRAEGSRNSPGQPRVRGEHISPRAGLRSLNGSAPRARGTRILLVAGRERHRVSPACAGNTYRRGEGGQVPAGQPRVRGEHPETETSTSPVTGSAPRARGTLGKRVRHGPVNRVSPACAGNTLARRRYRSL